MMTLALVSVHPDCCARCASASQKVFTSFPSTLNLNVSGAVASCQILIPLDVVKSRAFVGSTCPGARAKGTSCWACESSGYGGEKLSELLGIHDDRMVLSSLSLRVLTILVGDY